MFRKAVAAVLVAIPIGIAAPASARPRTTPSPTTAPTTAPTPDATDDALLAYGLFVADVQYEISGTNGTVVVTLFGPPQPEMPDQIAAVVWGTEPLRFDQVVVRWSTGQATRSSVDLQATLGPRPAGFDQRSVTEAVFVAGLSGWAIGLDEAARELFRTATWVLEMVVIGLAIVIALFVVLASLPSGRRDRDEYEAWH